MLINSQHFSVESVLEVHPDKVCDQICDAILDSYLGFDDQAKVAVECLGTGTSLVIGGEVFSSAEVDVEKIANQVYQEIGYQDCLSVTNLIKEQSPQLRQPISLGAAGDQGIMYGFACQMHENLLPLGVSLAHSIAKEIDILRKRTNQFYPDGKVQITYIGETIDTILISVQHPPELGLKGLRALVLNEAVAKVVSLNQIRQIMVNNKSTFFKGGFSNDTGLSGRKIICDTYCGLAPHGGGSFSGKDPSKIDRSGAYMARFVAKNIVANGLSRYCLLSVAYAFGEDKPIMLSVETGEKKRDQSIRKIVLEKFDFRPSCIIERLNLKRIKFRDTSKYGHFGNEEYTWEKVFPI